MIIKAIFEYDFTEEELIRYVNNEISDAEMDNDKMLELSALASRWVIKPDTSMSSLTQWASASIADGIESYFYDEMCDNYIEYYDSVIEEHKQMTEIQ